MLNKTIKINDSVKRTLNTIILAFWFLAQIGFSVFFVLAPLSEFTPLWFGLLWGIFWSVVLAYLISTPFGEDRKCSCSHKCPNCGSELIPIYEDTQNKSQ